VILFRVSSDDTFRHAFDENRDEAPTIVGMRDLDGGNLAAGRGALMRP
jgi:hypothetical protein